MESTTSSFVTLVRSRAGEQPSQTAYTFLGDGERPDLALDYRSLDQRARAIGSFLAQSGAAAERVLLLLPAGLEFVTGFFGGMFAGATVVPVAPPGPGAGLHPFERLRAIARDAEARFVLTTSSLRSRVDAILGGAPDLARMRWVTMEEIDDALAAEWHEPALDASAPALLQYTSGSTAEPRGVVVSHANLLHNSALIYRRFGHSAQSRGVIWLPPHHDMGLVGGVLQPLFAGFPVALMPPLAFLQRPLRWLEAVTRFGATTSGGPNFAYDLCVKRITPEQRAGLNLSSWDVAFTGAEPIRAGTLERFAAAFAASGFRATAFYPCYGLAEATLMVAGGRKQAPPVVRCFLGDALRRDQVTAVARDDVHGQCLVGCGTAAPESDLRIVDPETRVSCPARHVGEIWVAGPGVASGYWRRPDETAASFHARLAEAPDCGPFLRTGDLGFVDQDELFVAGRSKDLIIIYGQKHYPQDIEHTIESSHPTLASYRFAAVSVDRAGEECVVVLAEPERRRRASATPVARLDGALDADALTTQVRRAVAERHGVRVSAVHIVEPGAIPRTTSGKVRRHACRALVQTAAEETARVEQ